MVSQNKMITNAMMLSTNLSLEISEDIIEKNLTRTPHTCIQNDLLIMTIMISALNSTYSLTSQN